MPAHVFIATSLDGFIARPDGALDWLPQYGAEDYGYKAFMAGIDALVVGRKTFETVLGFAGAWPYGATPVVVLSSTLTKDSMPKVPEGADVRLLSGAPRDVIRTLAAQGLHRLYVDGGATIQHFLREGCIDSIVVTRVPVLLGRGIPLFGHLEKDVLLRHVATNAFPDGLVQSQYEVVRQAA